MDDSPRVTEVSASGSWMRRSSADSLPRSRRGSSDMSARLEVELRSHVFHHHSTSHEQDSPAPFPPCFSGDITEDLEAQVDDKVTISCTVHGHPRPEVAWHKDGVLLLQNSHGVELWSQGYQHKLVIPYIGHEHSGVYCIVAVNHLGRSECHCVLRVIDGDEEPELEPADSGVETPSNLGTSQLHSCTAGCRLPPEFLSLFRDQFCLAGAAVLMECEIAAWPAPQVTWSFNGQPIRAGDERFRLTSQGQRHRLRLLGVTAAEAGRICLTAENDSGLASCGALLIVEDPTSGRICNQKVIRMATKLHNKRPEKPTEDWQTTPSYSLVS